MNTELWYKSPARSFSEALPIGNGRLGAMVFGGIPREKILLNLDTFWSGCKRGDEREIPEETIRKIQTLTLNEQYKEAEELTESSLLGDYNESYMPLGLLHYELDHTNSDCITDYKRCLDLERAVHTVSYKINNANVTSQVLASYEDNVIMIKIKVDPVSRIDMTLWLDSPLQHQVTVPDANTMILSEQAPSHVVPNYIECDQPIRYDEDKPGMKAICRMEICTGGGSSYIKDGKIKIKGATEITMLLAAACGYKSYFEKIEQREEVLQEDCAKQLFGLRQYTYQQLLDRHTVDYQKLFHKMYFTLNESRDELSTSERLERLKSGEEDNGLFCLYFHYSRYLMIASSRTGSQPANLQGIWSDSVRPVWSCNWTININTQMNYWMIGPCNLLECHEPLMKMVKELSIEGQKSAKSQLHCKGWLANHNIDIWRQTSPVGGLAKYAFWPMGGVWLTNQIYDYYRFTKDTDFLRHELWPVMLGAARFCADWLIEGRDGYLHTAPSTSPENTFYDKNGTECAVSNSTTMDISLMKELFMNLLKTYEVLGERDSFYDEIKTKLGKLPEYKTGKDGQLLEWISEFQEKDSGHRHFSPLVGFHPGRVINKRDNKELVIACQKLIERRLKSGGGHIGWSCAWLINLFARLQDGEHAFYYLKCLLQKSTYDNLFDLHPPLGENDGEREVFQIDGNLGSAAGVAAMFVQSYLDEIELLPALPKNWTEGSMEGILAEGGFEVSIRWKEGNLAEAFIVSNLGEKARVRYREPIKAETEAEDELQVTYISSCIIEFPTKKGARYTITRK